MTTDTESGDGGRALSAAVTGTDMGTDKGLLTMSSVFAF